MMLSSVEDIEKYAIISYRDRAIINAFMPGPITVLLRCKNNVPDYVTHNTGIIGIRVPNLKNICDLIGFLQKPLLVPSANKSGEKPCKTYKEVKEVFKDELGFILEEDAGGELPSTIIDLTTENIKIVREGPITLNDIERSIRKMKIAVGSDHGGFEYKEQIIKHLVANGHEVVDVGTNSLDSCHYPIYGIEVGKKVASGECSFGVVICTSGEGIAIAANKIKGIRCGIGYNDEVSKLMRQHNDANVIAFGQKFMDLNDVLRRIDIFLSTPFEGGRHETRVNLIKNIEK